MLSILIVSRAKDNGDSKLLTLFDSLWQNSAKKKDFEVLIKMDNDDDINRNLISEFSKFSFPIKYLIDNRGNGRLDLHLSYTKLLPLASKTTTMFTTYADDFIAEFNWDIIIEEGLKKLIGDIFILQHTHNPPKDRADYDQEPFNMSYNLNTIDNIISLEVAPIWSKNLLYLCGGFGHVSYTDVWIYYLQRMLWDLHNIRIMFFTASPYVKRVDPQGAWRTPEQTQEKINEDTKNYGFIKSDYFKEMIRIQADNIMRYLKFSNYSKSQV